MRLDYDLFRELLFIIEEETIPYHCSFSPISQNEKLSNYSFTEISYHLKKLTEANLITSTIYSDGEVSVSDITMKGHDFLAQIRSDTVWNKTKSFAEKIGVKSLNSLISISSNVLAELIKNHFI